MTKINIEYVKRLFEYIDKNESISAPHTIKSSQEYSDIHRGLGPFLDTVCDYADSENIDIPETVVSEKYTDNRYYYNIRYEKTVLEIGMYYDYDLIYVKNTLEYDEESVIDCIDMIKRNERGTKKGVKVLTFEPKKGNKDNTKKEDK